MITKTMVERAVDLWQSGRPTDSASAEQLWHDCSSSYGLMTTEEAKYIYRLAGYVPFSGFPLRRSNLEPWKHQAAVNRAVVQWQV